MNSRTARILVVEDEPSLVETISYNLRREGYEVESERGHDVRRELARAVVTSGWGLLELRPMRMSLEDIFLSLTTDEAPTPAAEEHPGEETVNA